MKRFINVKSGGVICWLLLLCMFSVGSAWGQSKIEIWSEDWSEGSANDTPDKVNTSCSASNSGTKLYNEKLASGTAPELLLKGKDDLKITISDLKGCYGELDFQFKSNNTNNSVVSSTAGVTVGALSTSNKVRSCKITVPQGTNSLVVIIKNTTSNNTRLDDIVLSGIGMVTQTTVPILSPKSETSFVDKLMVTASCATDGAIIYYTTDEGNPTTASEVFPVSGLEITQTTTLKAIAVKDGLDNSEVVTATYTKLEPYADIAALKAAGIATVEGVDCVVKLTDAVVTYAEARKAYIQDATAGLYIYGDNTLKAGMTLNGEVQAVLKLYNGLNELEVSGGELDKVTVVEGAAIPETEVTLVELNQNFAKYESMRVKVVDATVTSAFTNQNGEISQGGSTMALRAANMGIQVDVQATVDVVGYPGLYNTIPQLNVLQQGDVSVKTAGKTQATLAFDSDAYSVNVGESLTVAAITNSSASVVYSSSDETIATVNENTGEVQTANKVGTVTITATVAENDEFTGATAICTVNVVDPSALPEAKALVAEKGGIYYAMLNTVDGTKLNSGVATILNGKVVTDRSDLCGWYVNEENGIIQSIANNQYVAHGSGNTDLGLRSNSFKWDYLDGMWQCKVGGNQRAIGYNSSTGKFGTYLVSDDTYPKAVAMPIVDGYVRNVASGDYGTICLPYAVAAEDMAGAEFFSIAGKVLKDGEPQSIVLEQVATLEAGVPYVFSATSDKLIATYSGKAVAEAGESNGLIGSFEGQDVAEGMYLISDQNKVQCCGTGCKISGNRAYIDMDKVPEHIGEVGVNQRLISFEDATGISETMVEGGLADVYTLSGVEVRHQVNESEATQGLPQGIYIVNGKKVVVK